MKMKRRILSLLLTVCLVAGLMPTAAFAADTGTGKAIQLGTSGISGYDSTNGYDYIYFGNWTAPDNYTTSGPVKWRVLDTKTNMENATEGDGLFLLSDVLLGTGEYGDVYFDNSGSNVWQNSSARAWCKDFAGEEGAATNVTNAFTAGELGAVLATKKNDEEFTSSTYKVPFSASEKILNGDKVFFLSAEESENAAYGFTDDNARKANYGTSAGVWWLRSPDANDTYYAGVVVNDGYVDSYDVDYDWAARPAFNLNLNSVLFTSAADNSGHISFGTAIPERSGDEWSGWKVTLKDSNSFADGASVDKTALAAGGTLTITHKALSAISGDYTNVTAALTDASGNLLYYGSINDSTTATESTVTIPADLSEGTYTLSIYGEDRNDEKRTDYATGTPYTVTLTVDNTAPTLSKGTASRDSETAATVKFTSSEAGTYYYEVVEKDAGKPNIDTTAAGTACVNGENAIDLTKLSGTGAKDIYIVVKDAAGNVSDPALKITIPKYTPPLDMPANLAWDSTTPGKATWGEVTNASGYSVQLYKDGTARGDAVSVTDTTHTFTITEAGSYTFKVKAVGDETSYADSPEAGSGELHTVHFDTNGGSAVAMQLVTDGGKATAPTAPTKTGYSFGGWYADNAFATAYNFDNATISEAATIYAKWDMDTYDIDYDLDGGSVDASNPTTYTVESDDITLNNPTKTGHTFAGWTGTDLSKATKTVTIAKGSTGNRSYKATWTADTYSVTLNKNGGTITAGKNVTEYTYGTGATLPAANDITRDGYKFDGWYEKSDFSGNPVTAISPTDTGAKTYHAKWLSKDAGVTSVSVDGTKGTISGTYISVVLPYGSTIPTVSSAVSITTATGANVSALSTMDNGVTWTFTVTAEDGTTTKVYTINVTVAPFVAVTEITGVPTEAVAGTDLTLTGTVVPSDATNQKIVWSMDESNTLEGAEVKDGRLITTITGTAKVKATIKDGIAGGSDYTQVFEITVKEKPAAEIITKTEINEDFTDDDIPQELKDAGYDTVAKIDSRLKTVLTQLNSNIEETALYDVILMYSEDGGKTWIKADETHFPKSGKLLVSLPVPEGTDINTHDYIVSHMFTSSAFGKVPGNTEQPEVTEKTGNDGKQYIDFYVTGLSPVMVAWENTVKDGSAGTGDDSDMLPWVIMAATAVMVGAGAAFGRRRRTEK